MSRESVADALDRAAEAIAQAAHELRGTDQPAAGSDVPPQRVPAPAAPLPPKRTAPDTSGITVCPAHNKPFEDGRFGPYCKSRGPEDEALDPNWYNDKGYCRVTPKSAGAWLKQHPNRPAPAPLDDDSLPF